MPMFEMICHTAPLPSADQEIQRILGGVVQGMFTPFVRGTKTDAHHDSKSRIAMITGVTDEWDHQDWVQYDWHTEDQWLIDVEYSRSDR
jgi:hypothetical protein